MTSLVSLNAITKTFPGVVANDSINLTIEAGKIHALLGENGAGKSTLVNILFGLLQADAGDILWQGKSIQIANPAMARELGIAMVFQHFSLFNALSVLENIALGLGEPASESLASRIHEVSRLYGLPLDPQRAVYTLSVGERQRIEIVRCLLQSPTLLIMDEPTSVLTPQEVNELFVTLKRLADEGMAILYISHKLQEIQALCDTATILRGGRRVASADPASTSAAELAGLMMGVEPAGVAARSVSEPRLAESQHSPQTAPATEVRLALMNLDRPAENQNEISLHGLSMEVAAGEIVGIAGVAGNGQDELFLMLTGEWLAATDSAIELDGERVGYVNARGRRQRGLGAVPEERLGHAAVPTMSLSDNAFLTAHHRRPLQPFGLLSGSRSRRLAVDIIERFNVQCHGPGSLAGSLSGGNLQKFIVGREILQTPDVLVVSQPTWGVDAGAAATIHRALRELADQGSAILVISQDLDELMLLTDRLGALCAGRLSSIYPTQSVSLDEVGLLMSGNSLRADRSAA